MLLATYTVTNTGVDAGSLRAAIASANANAGPDVIRFNIPGTPAPVHQIRSVLPEITDTLDIDATSQPGYSAGRPMVQLLGIGVGGDYTGLLFRNASNSRVRGLIVSAWGNSGIRIEGGSGHVIESNWIGTDPSGNLSVANKVGILVNASTVRIGGTTAAQRNVISGNSAATTSCVGIQLDGNDNVVAGNYIGTTREGNNPLPNAVGISVGGSRNRVGGTTAAERNVISGNSTGVVIGKRVSATVHTVLDNAVSGNYVGTNASGNLGLPNTSRGVWVTEGSDRTLIGGATAGAGNLISGNATGVSVDAPVNMPGAGVIPPRATRFEGNTIGLGATGGVIGNTTGVLIRHHSFVGGTTPGARNVISGNNIGLHIAGETLAVQGNYIGLNPGGTAARPNAVGVVIDYIYSVPVGGTEAGARNVISGNTESGIRILRLAANSEGHRIEGNYIGTDAAGAASVGNAAGIEVNGGRANIGGTTASARNVISGNTGDGVRMNGGSATLRGNYIGTNAAGTAALRNDLHGVLIASGFNSVESNLIAHNGGDGIRVTAGTGNAFLSNSIHSNAGLGIDLVGDGVTPNDAGDADTGPNESQNFPVITAVLGDGTNTIVRGTVSGRPAANTFRVQFFSSPAADPSGHGEGATYLGETTLAVGTSGAGAFDVTLPAVQQGHVVTATLTARPTVSGTPPFQTSEFSAAVAVPAPDTRPPAVYGVFVNGSAWAESFRLKLESMGRGDRRAGFSVPSGSLQTLPWVNVNEVCIDFSEAVDVRQDDLVVRGESGTYAFASFTNQGTSAVWRLQNNVRPGRLTLELKSGGVKDLVGRPLDGEWTGPADNWPSGDGAPGGDFVFQMNVRPGDANRNGVVNVLDDAQVRWRYGAQTTSANYSIFADFDGNGRINATDLLIARAQRARALPTTKPSGAAAV